jgi:hypothetical protein
MLDSIGGKLMQTSENPQINGSNSVINNWPIPGQDHWLVSKNRIFRQQTETLHHHAIKKRTPVSTNTALKSSWVSTPNHSKNRKITWFPA